MCQNQCQHLRQPKASFVWRANSPWCAQAAGRAPAPRPKLPKDAGSKPKWSRSAWLSRREGGRGGAVVSRTPSRVLVSGIIRKNLSIGRISAEKWLLVLPGEKQSQNLLPCGAKFSVVLHILMTDGEVLLQFSWKMVR